MVVVLMMVSSQLSATSSFSCSADCHTAAHVGYHARVRMQTAAGSHILPKLATTIAAVAVERGQARLLPMLLHLLLLLLLEKLLLLLLLLMMMRNNRCLMQQRFRSRLVVIARRNGGHGTALGRSATAYPAPLAASHRRAAVHDRCSRVQDRVDVTGQGHGRRIGYTTMTIVVVVVAITATIIITIIIVNTTAS